MHLGSIPDIEVMAQFEGKTTKNASGKYPKMVVKSLSNRVEYSCDLSCVVLWLLWNNSIGFMAATTQTDQLSRKQEKLGESPDFRH